MKSHLIVALLGMCAAMSALADDAAPAATAAASTVSATTAPKVICLQNSIRCFTARNPTLDLKAPPLTRVFSQAELEQKLQEPEEVHETETVQVQGERQITPVSVGLMAIPWAVIHPTQAWRI